MDYKWLTFPIIAVIIVTVAGNFLFNKPYVKNAEISVENVNEISIQGKNMDIFFDENSDIVQIPSGLYSSKNYNTLEVSVPDSNPEDMKIKIIIGTKSSYEKINIDGSTINLTGIVKAQNFIISGTSINFNSDVVSSELQISGIGIKINSKINSENIEINTVGIDGNIEILYNKIFNINTLGINSDIKYTNTRNDSQLNLNSFGGNVNLITPKNDYFNLKTKKIGMINLNEINY